MAMLAWSGLNPSTKSVKHSQLRPSYASFAVPINEVRSSQFWGSSWLRVEEWSAFHCEICRIYTVYHLYIYYTHITYPSVSILIIYVAMCQTRRQERLLGHRHWVQILKSWDPISIQRWKTKYQHVWIILLWSKDCSDVCNKLQPPVATKHELTKVLLILDEATPSSGPATPFTRSVAKKEY